MRKILEKCPSCGSDLEVTRLNCKACDTVVLGHFEPCRFCKLSPESMNFLEAFVKSRGNVKEMERELGISYWVVRGRLNDLIKELGFEAESIPDADEAVIKTQRQAILSQVDRGEIDAAEAATLLAQLK
jgi:hypothetical protein